MGERVEDIGPTADVNVYALLAVLRIDGRLLEAGESDGRVRGVPSQSAASVEDMDHGRSRRHSLSTLAHEVARAVNSGPSHGMGDPTWVRAASLSTRC